MRIAGVELGGTKCVCVLSQDGATIVEARRIATTDPAETMAGIEDALDAWGEFDAIGIASFGPRHIIRSDESLTLSEDLPVAITAVDTEKTIAGLIDDTSII